MIQVFKTAPKDFDAHISVAGCFLWFNERFLLLRRSEGKYAEKTWGLPAGKIEPGETPVEAAVRETCEETGLLPQNPIEIGQLYMRVPESIDYIFHMYYDCYEIEPKVTLDLTENDEAGWYNLEEALKLPLIGGGAEALKYCYDFILLR